jgi:hypothetical protein
LLLDEKFFNLENREINAEKMMNQISKQKSELMKQKFELVQKLKFLDEKELQNLQKLAKISEKNVISFQMFEEILKEANSEQQNSINRSGKIVTQKKSTKFSGPKLGQSISQYSSFSNPKISKPKITHLSKKSNLSHISGLSREKLNFKSIQ